MEGRQPAVDLLGEDVAVTGGGACRTRGLRQGVALAAASLLAAGAAGCSGATTDAEPDAGAAPQSATSSPAPPPRATPAPRPPRNACYDLGYNEALAPTSESPSQSCRRPHTAETYGVGRVDNLADGHLLAVDSQQVQRQVARTCPAELSDFVGGTREDLRLSMLRPVWFTPTLAQSAAGADWYRCDVVSLLRDERLATVRGSLEGVLDTPQGRTRYGMCGTAPPDQQNFKRVACSRPHSWRAISVVDLGSGRYPGKQAVNQAAQACEDAAREAAADPLDYDSGYEGPDREEWAAGKTFVRCWLSD